MPASMPDALHIAYKVKLPDRIVSVKLQISQLNIRYLRHVSLRHGL